MPKATHSRELSHQSSEQLERQRAETDMVAAAINEMAAASQEVAGNVVRTAEATQMANQQAEQGKQVASAAEEQSAVAEEINRSISNIALLSDQTAPQARQNARLSDELAGTANSQSELVARFRI
ncbi:hypothetical protein [Halopseudomonas sp. Lyrl_26]|uniref:hypothetical protein n=1 Tax=Halopseudomonas sp. Lyrl_26 TaxID=3110923 RepID=UPI003F8023BD